MKQPCCFQQQFIGPPRTPQAQSTLHSTRNASHLISIFSRICILLCLGVQITMPLSTLVLSFSFLARSMVGGCLYLKGSSGCLGRRTPITSWVGQSFIMLDIISSWINVGELERTMLETFCASVNLKSLLIQHHDMPIIEKFKGIVEKAAKDRSRDPLAGIIIFPDIASSLTPPKRRRQCTILSERAISTLQAMDHQLRDQLCMPATITCCARHTIGKVSFTTRTESKCDCNIFFRSTISGAVAPGIIQYIVSIPSISTTSERIIFVIERYAQLPEEATFNLFSSHASFGASLWSSKMSPVLEAVPADRVISHATIRPWVKGIILCKIMDRVSIHHFLSFSTYV